MKTTTGDYGIVTEQPGIRVSREAVEMMLSRYRFAAELADDKDVLEVACGAGQGLGYLARRARSVVGGDTTASLLRQVRATYGDAIPAVRLDAHHLPFRDDSFDLVLLNEAIYYLAEPDRFLKECARVLRPGGRVLIVTINREWKDFNPSPFSTRYPSACELGEWLEEAGFRARLWGAFEVAEEGLRSRGVSLIKRSAVRLGVIPKSMKGKTLLKRLFLGRLSEYPAVVDDDCAEYVEPRPIDPAGSRSQIPAPRYTVPQYKVLYAVGALIT